MSGFGFEFGSMTLDAAVLRDGVGMGGRVELEIVVFAARVAWPCGFHACFAGKWLQFWYSFAAK